MVCWMIATADTTTKTRTNHRQRRVTSITCRFFAYIPLAAILAATHAGCGGIAEEAPAARVDFAMDTVVQQRWYGPDADEMLDAVTEALNSMEADTSLYRGDSFVSRINDAAGVEFVPVPEDIFSLIRRCKELSAQSQAAGGSVDLTAGSLALTWNVTGESPQVPSEAEIAAALDLVDYRDVLLDEEAGAVMLRRKGQVLDLGALVKGYACDVVKKLLEEYQITGGFAAIGSNIVSVGAKPGGSPFTFGIRDPAAVGDQYIGTLSMPLEWEGVSLDVMATSGTYERYFEAEGKAYHHIFGLEDGYPVDKGLVSVSVLSGDGLLTDYLSTHLMTIGVEGLVPLLSDPAVNVIAIGRDNTVYLSEHLRPYYQSGALKQEYQLYEG